ncbi:hypothetical protein [Pseudoponticoccus marisrubri]|uniref:AAA+ family ATPase n=1 Tax=Pseudoponticoccus marisrubri TaxID=1685382 RepID=A0A0W7WN60_9RHOB|nr:hypothetical protein [Pseudoponticoccus marisrubri]KUF12025.1 hypothetical protein AVJ23_05475 [Pseudoponticoccus marisrubri]
MRQIAAPFLALSLLAAPVQAQEEGNGLTLMEEGARLFLRGLMDETDEAIGGLQDMAREIEPFLNEFAQEMGPALRDLADKVEDWSAYHPPEMLPNGDIILRRKVEEGGEDTPEANPDGTTDL